MENEQVNQGIGPVEVELENEKGALKEQAESPADIKQEQSEELESGSELKSEIESKLEQELKLVVEQDIEAEIEAEIEPEIEPEPVREAEIVQTEYQTDYELDKPIKGKKPKLLKFILLIPCILLVIYFGMTLYYLNHFDYGSQINGIDVSNMSIFNVEKRMASELQNYTLILKERAGETEHINATNIGLRYSSEDIFEQLKKHQNENPFNWILAYFEPKSILTVGTTYDEKLLMKHIDKLTCFESKHIIEPKNPSFQYKDSGYVIVDEIAGNQVDKEILVAHLTEAIFNKEVQLDLEGIQCYIKPQYQSNSQNMLEVKDRLNKFISSEITYTFGNNKEVLDGSIINQWLSVDDNFNILLDEKKVEDYIDTLSAKYNISGRTRNFKTSLGDAIQIEGGDFTDSIDKSSEVQTIISVLNQGLSITLEPSYCDIGHTFVEINLSQQHLWFYKNSVLIIEGDVVTGNVSSNHSTPRGIYSLKRKAENAVLRGPGYAAPVDFWMPFNDGIGMHDANWRSRFGGNIYKTNGSHGCINCSEDLVKVIYDNIETGTPIVCY